MPARILIATAEPSLQRLLSDSVRGDGHDVLPTTTGPDALRRWTLDQPDLVILDAELAGFDGYELVHRIRGAEAVGAHVPMVMLGADPDVQAKVRGLRAGADDYLVKPFHPTELAARIRTLLVRSRFDDRAPAVPVQGQVHAYYGAKGGVGTTTMAVNVAVGLHRIARRKVCLVDADIQFGDARVFLDLAPDRRSIVDAVEAPSIDADLLRNIVVHHETGIDVLLAPPTPEAAEQVLAHRGHMSQLIGALRTMYDYVIVDLDKRLDDQTLDVITVADVLFVVMTADLSCIKNVRLVTETMSQIGLHDDKVRLLMNRSNAFTGISVKSVEGVLRRPVRYQVVNDYRVAISALNSGEPFMQNRVDSVLGRSVVDFVRAIDAMPAPRPAPTRAPPRMVPALG